VTQFSKFSFWRKGALDMHFRAAAWTTAALEVDYIAF
jgi:hypothetical protein